MEYIFSQNTLSIKYLLKKKNSGVKYSNILLKLVKILMAGSFSYMFNSIENT